MFTIPDARTQARAEYHPSHHPTLPPAFDAQQCPIIAQHVFGLAPQRPTLELVSNQPSRRPDDPVERLTWDAYVAAIDAHDHHQTASTQRSRTAALLAWRHVFLVDEHGEVWS